MYEQCVWMELAYVWTMCMDETDVICDMWYETYVLDMWYETYVLDMWYIFAVKIVGVKKTEKRDNMQDLCRLPPTAKGSLPSVADGKEDMWQATVLPGRLTIWSVCLQWLTAKRKKTLPTAADGKGLPCSDVGWHHSADGKGLPKFAVSGGRQRPPINHLTE